MVKPKMETHWKYRAPEEIAFLQAAGRRFKKRRENRGLTQKEVAELIKTAPSLICRFEKYGTALPLHKLAKACMVFKCSVDYILGMAKKP